MACQGIKKTKVKKTKRLVNSTFYENLIDITQPLLAENRTIVLHLVPKSVVGIAHPTELMKSIYKVSFRQKG